jgi:cytochrome b561
MSLKNTPERWGGVSQSLHWIIAALILAMAWIGLTMGDLPNGPDKIKTYALHKSIGITILALVALRLLWRLYAGTPRPVPGMSPMQARIAGLAHAGIYVLLFAIPISGWVVNSSAGFPLQWFGLVNLPHIVGKSHDLHELAEEAHELLFWVLALMVVAHAGAAFFHHLFQRDATLARMLPQGWIKVGGATDGAPAASAGAPPSNDR